MAWINMDLMIAADPPSPKEIRQVEEYAARKAKARFYADENLPAQAVSFLRGLGGRVKTVEETGRRGHPDEDHAAYALRNGLILVSCDRDFLNERRFPLVHCPAIIVFDFGSGTTAEIWQSFRCLGAVFAVPQFFDKWCKIHAHADSWIEYTRHLDGSSSHTRMRYSRGRMEQWLGD